MQITDDLILLWGEILHLKSLCFWQAPESMNIVIHDKGEYSLECLKARGCEGKCIQLKIANGRYFSRQPELKAIVIINFHCVQQKQRLTCRQPHSDLVPFIPFSVQKIY